MVLDESQPGSIRCSWRIFSTSASSPAGRKVRKNQLNHSRCHLTSGTEVYVIACCKNLAVNRCFWTRQLTQWLINHTLWPDSTCSSVTLEWHPGSLWKTFLALCLTQEVIYSLTRRRTLFLRGTSFSYLTWVPHSYNRVPRQSTKTIPLLDCVSINDHYFMFSLFNTYMFELCRYKVDFYEVNCFFYFCVNPTELVCLVSVVLLRYSTD